MYDTITIPLEEYKELLIIKGKYEELKNNQKITPAYPSFPGVRQADITWDFKTYSDEIGEASESA